MAVRSMVPKDPGLFCPRAAASNRVPKGAIRGPLVQKKPRSQLSRLAVRREECKVYRLGQSTAVTRLSCCHHPSIALVMRTAMLRWAVLPMPVLVSLCVHGCSVCFVCLLSWWTEIKAFFVTLLHSPYSKKVPATAVCAFASPPYCSSHGEYHLLAD